MSFSGKSGSYGEHMFSSVISCLRSQSGWATTFPPQSCASDLVSSHAHQHLLSIIFVLPFWSVFGLLTHCGFNLHLSPSGNGVEYLCVCFSHLYALHCKCLFLGFLIVCLLLMRLESSSLTLMGVLCRYGLPKTFLPVCSLSFSIFNRVFRSKSSNF